MLCLALPTDVHLKCLDLLRCYHDLHPHGWKVRSGVEMRNMRNLVNLCCVPLIAGSISWPFHDIASPNLVDRYYMSQKVTSTNGCY